MQRNYKINLFYIKNIHSINELKNAYLVIVYYIIVVVSMYNKDYNKSCIKF